MDVNALVNSVFGSAGAGIDKTVTAAKSSGLASGFAGGAAAGGLAALLLSNKKARKMGTSALKYGGMAVVGGLAYKAWRDYKQQQTASGGAPKPETPPQGSIFDLAAQRNAPEAEDLRLPVVQAMISAAKADGHIDANERAKIEMKIEELGLDHDERMFLVDALDAPSDPIAVARLSRCEEQSAQLYVASILALDVDAPEEKRYLERLGDALRLPAELRSRLEMETQRVVG